MRYRTLGRTGITVSELCLGAMMYGAMGNPDHDDCIRQIHHALDHGMNFIDTADVYSRGESEQIVGKALRGNVLRGEAVAGDDPGYATIEDTMAGMHFLRASLESSARGAVWVDL